MMQNDSFKITSLSLDERVMFMDAFNITLEEYVKNYGKDAINICIDNNDYQKKLKLYFSYIKKRNEGYSVASIIRKKEFYKSVFLVDENVLIPRPETETLVEYICDNIFKLYSKNKVELPQVLDMCTGSGCIGISLLKEAVAKHMYISMTMVDISKKALDIAKKNYINIIRNDMKYYKNTKYYTVDFIESDLYNNLPKSSTFDLIVSNPPYVSISDYQKVSVEVKREPEIALVGGIEGLDVITKLITESYSHLNSNGILIFEFGLGEEGEIVKMLKKGYKNIKIIKDLTSRPRFAYAEKV